jgi:uncharacterized protein (TIGR03437 family)
VYAAPVIAAGGVVNSADQADAASAGIPKGGLFTIYGTELAPREAQAPAVPLPTTLSTVRVRISAPSPLGVRDYYAPLHYVSPGQINAVLPSILPEGAVELRVVVNTVSSQPVTIPVVSRRFSAFTLGRLGFGPAVAQQYSAAGAQVNRFGAPARPVDVVVLWGTGLGPVASGEDAAPVAGNLRDDIIIRIGGVSVRPLYAGRAPGLPGVDQINFPLPDSAAEGCFTPLLVEVGGVGAAQLTLATAAEGDVCASEFGLPASALVTLDEGKTLRVAVVNYESDPGGQERQAIEAWAGEYDAAHLSLFAILRKPPEENEPGWCDRRAYTRSRSQSADALYGLRVLRNVPLALRITGEDCAWAPISGTGILQTRPNAACAATGVSLTVGSGQNGVALQAALPEVNDTGIQQFSAALSGPSLRAVWELAGEAEDMVATVTAGSTFTLPGNIFSGATNVRELTCLVPATAGEFVFTREQTEWARGLQTPTPPTLEVSKTAVRALDPDDEAPPLRDVDVVLLRIRDHASAVSR